MGSQVALEWNGLGGMLQDEGRTVECYFTSWQYTDQLGCDPKVSKNHSNLDLTCNH